MYDLNNTGQYALGCATHPSTRKFTLRVGSPANGSDSPYGQIDLHQLGAGYQGHIWFAHVYPPDYFDGSTNAKHEVVGTWSPDRCIIDARLVPAGPRQCQGALWPGPQFAPSRGLGVAAQVGEDG